ncbi:hypothetical protein [Dysgonomonas sp. Marseille-P4361]|uniref:hypothetical protein n=1 Tax=Dysgonomonas sp. Marseille-P4361 TaxID=2161820 RepID=UPI000D5581B5|nr:hypothetical protein [Dysgonomonas sp. Marseille-P4361]
MKKLILTTFISFLFISNLLGQEGHKINADIDLSFGLHYFNSEINNPLAGGASLGYEYDVNMFFGVEAGFRFGGFNQKIGYTSGPNIQPEGVLKAGLVDIPTPEAIYKGTYWAPYIAPKFYLPIGYDDKKDRARFIFIENRFSLTHISLDLDKVNNQSGSTGKNCFMYEIRAGYMFPINERWGMSCWLGYNTFDFSKVKPSEIRYKNSTPLQIGIGFNYIISQ